MGYRLCRILYMSDCIQISSFKRGKIVCVVTGHNFNHMGTSQILKLIFHMAPCTVYYANHIRYFSCSFNYQFSSVQFSRSVVSNSLRPHEPQHASPPYPSPTPRVHPNSCLLSWWCHPTISSSVVPFSCLQSFPASGALQMSQLFVSSGQTIGASASASVLPMNIPDWLDLLAVQGTLKSLLHHHSSKASILRCSAFFIVWLSHPYMTTGKTIALTRWTLLAK